MAEIHSFHVTDLRAAEVELPEEEAGHAVRVLRLVDGASVRLLDGQGNLAEATLRVAGKKHAVAIIRSRSAMPRERTGTIHLAVAPTKAIDRFEWMLEKATEIGVDRITPLITQRSERTHLRPDRLQKILVGAMKQSRRAWLPSLDAPIDLDAFIDGGLPPQRLFGWCGESTTTLQATYVPSTNAVMLIGPEGDFTAEEAALMRSKGLTAVTLGDARLRTETAAIAAITWMNFAQRT